MAMGLTVQVRSWLMPAPSQVLEVLHDGHSLAVDGGGMRDEGWVMAGVGIAKELD